MIKFFRKIRKDLLSKGKTGKYLKYALGEIALVVIGILIALQINNWNEDNKAKRNEKSSVEQLLSDAQLDSIFFENRKLALESQLDFYERLINDCQNKPEYVQERQSLARIKQPFIKLAHQSNVLTNNPNVYDELLERGLMKALQDYKSQYEFIVASFTTYNSKLDEFYMPLRIKYHNEIPELFETRSPSEYYFLCNSGNDLGIIKLIKTYANNTLYHTINFIEVNHNFLKELRAFGSISNNSNDI